VASVLSGTAVYFAVAQWHRAHIAVTFVAEMLLRKSSPRRVRAIQIMQSVSDVITTVYLVLLLIWGIPMITQYKDLGIKMPSQSFAFWPFWVVFLIGLAMYAGTTIIHSYLGARGLTDPEEPGHVH